MSKYGTSKERRKGVEEHILLERKVFGCSLCVICGKPLYLRSEMKKGPLQSTFEHIIPRSEGGTYAVKNMAVSHKICNELRGNKPLKDVSWLTGAAV